MDVPSGKFRWTIMGNHPVEGTMRFNGDVDELPLHDGEKLVESGHCVKMPDEAPEVESPRPEPSKIIGVNITEEQYLAKEEAEDDASEVAPSAVKPRKGSRSNED